MLYVEKGKTSFNFVQLEATDAGAELAELHRAGGAQGEQRRFCFYLGLKLRIKIVL